MIFYLNGKGYLMVGAEKEPSIIFIRKNYKELEELLCTYAWYYHSNNSYMKSISTLERGVDIIRNNKMLDNNFSEKAFKKWSNESIKDYAKKKNIEIENAFDEFIGTEFKEFLDRYCNVIKSPSERLRDQLSSNIDKQKDAFSRLSPNFSLFNGTSDERAKLSEQVKIQKEIATISVSLIKNLEEINMLIRGGNEEQVEDIYMRRRGFEVPNYAFGEQITF